MPTLTAAMSRDNAYALIIGIGEYERPDIPTLKYARLDAEKLYDVLVDPARGDFDPEKVKILVGKGTKALDIKQAINPWLYKQTLGKQDATVVLFFAGHGDMEIDMANQAKIDTSDREKDGYARYLMAYDTNPDDLLNTALSNADLAKLLNTLNVNNLLIFLDACFSEGVAGTGSAGRSLAGTGKAIDPNDIAGRIKEAKRPVIISAAKSNQKSWEHESLGHGIFTYHLLEALSGDADADKNGYTSVHEVFTYLSEKVPGTAHVLCKQLQHPVITPEKSEVTDFPLIAHRDKLAAIKRKERKDRLAALHRNQELTTDEFERELRLLDAAAPSGKEARLARTLYKLLDGESSLQSYRAVRKYEEEHSSQPVQPGPEPSPNTVPAPQSDRISSEQPLKDETPIEITSQPGVSWNKLLRASIPILFVAAVALSIIYGAVFGPKISIKVLDLNWEPAVPKPGETVKFTAKFASTHTVREFAGGYWPHKREIEGKRFPHTFTESWSIAGIESKRNRVEVFESGAIQTSHEESAFDRPGRYTVSFSLSVVRDDHRNEIIRDITVGDK